MYNSVHCGMPFLSQHSHLSNHSFLPYRHDKGRMPQNQPQMCHSQHLHIVQCIGHSNFIHQYTALLPINFIYIIYPKPKSDPGITKNPDIYFQPINRAKPKWGISIEFGSICNEGNKMMTLEFRRLDALQARS